MARTYCPKRNGIACAACGNASWGTPMRVQRFALAVATLAAMGGVQGDRFRCPVAKGDAWLTIGATPVEIDRPLEGCYTLGNMVIASRNGNQGRNGGEDAAWAARYAAAVQAAAATVGPISGEEARRVWDAWHPVAHSEQAATGATWWE